MLKKVLIRTRNQAYLSIIMKRVCFIIIALALPIFLAAQNMDSVRLNITISSNDLSEDMSSLSSGNDELILIVYPGDVPFPTKPLLQTEFVFDQNIHLFDTTINTNPDLPKNYVIFLIERDSKVSMKRIESVTRLYTNEIRPLYNLKQSAELEEYFGDEDLLLFCNAVFTNEENELTCITSFINNLDSYSYRINASIKE